MALAAALTLGGQLELSFSGATGWHGLAHGMLLFAQTAPVAGRRIAPAVAAGIGAAGLAVEAVVSTPTNTLSGLLAGLVLLYGIGRYQTGLRMIALTGGIASALAVHMLRLPARQASDLVFAAVFSAAAWLAGRTMRRREIERVGAQAEAEREKAAAAAALDAAVTDERRRIARELHDVVAHGMGVMVVQAAAAEQLLEFDPSAAREPLTTVRATGQDALAEMRRLLGLLRDGAGDDGSQPQPGLGQVPVLVEQLRRAGMPIASSVTGTPVELPDGLQLCAYRIVQEALTNSLKHADGAPTAVTLRYLGDALNIQVRNQVAATRLLRAEGPGHGLVGMRERVRLYGGTLTAGPQPDGSFLIDATLQIHA